MIGYKVVNFCRCIGYLLTLLWSLYSSGTTRVVTPGEGAAPLDYAFYPWWCSFRARGRGRFTHALLLRLFHHCYSTCTCTVACRMYNIIVRMFSTLSTRALCMTSGGYSRVCQFAKMLIVLPWPLLHIATAVGTIWSILIKEVSFYCISD